MIYLGIDPGLTGAVAAINSANDSAMLFDLPTKEVIGGGMVKRRIDGLDLAHMLRTLASSTDDVLVTCELVGVMGGKNNAVQTQGSLMRTFGAIEAILDAVRFPTNYVRPQAWKKFYDLGKDKSAGLDMARRLYPSAQDALKRVKDHNRAEALLLAHYGRAHHE
jgi:crossover junction endodeoxyribonuclease RuvC